MKTYHALITASMFIEIEAEDYKDANEKALKQVDGVQHLTTGALKYLGIKWELDFVQEEK